MNFKHILVSLAVTSGGCQGGATDGVELAPVEANTLGITHVEITHGLQHGDLLLTIRGLDDSEQEIATATLRTGQVLYSFDPDLHPAAWSAGTELTTIVGESRFVSISPDREPHEAKLPMAELTTFARLAPVAAAIQAEAGIWFAPPANEDEVAFTASNCTASRFPSNVAAAQQCCQDGNATWHKIGASGANLGLIAYRTYGPACQTSNGSLYCGNPGSQQPECYYGPCGAHNEGTFGTIGTGNAVPVVFVPAIDPSVCGADGNGTAAGGVVTGPEEYSSITRRTIYPSLTGTCNLFNCGRPNCTAAYGEVCNNDTDCCGSDTLGTGWSHCDFGQSVPRCVP